jgi:NAD(P)-dependent dehydrogenase (short-subunit alcohol dehydrogenase family)
MNKIPDQYQAAPELLKDKVILVTGAGGGIGRESSLCFAAHGATVILLGRSNEKLEAVYDEIEAAGLPQPVLFTVDMLVATMDDYRALADAIADEFGRLDGLLHNASILGERSPIGSYKPQLWQDVMQVNVNAQMMLTQALLPMLDAAPAAAVVFTSSGVGRRGRAHWGAYAVSKFATEGLMQVLADELENIGEIRVNSLNPGATRTGMRAAAYPAEDPATLKRPEDIMPAYLYLMGNDSAGITGQAFNAQETDLPNTDQGSPT